jgi:hypothetical protein
MEVETTIAPATAGTVLLGSLREETSVPAAPRSRLLHQLMTRRDLDAIMTASDMRYPAIELAKGGIHCAIDNPPTAG